ncbi:family 43 glycosylhydrolase [Nonomuraea phyllanthi]|uniref:Family 43 glycosylhydrolase n=1 Tax=Nonomuraea phyllanthi TaxID=2219224 RepID=A0A5C4W1N8_9ACTN|nr:family 43 glycosylhydrolase [Nonomuraea phyllanthi]KAB8191532.1 family 43 glycosylhydrolase [Nonomuraea phyllanthi]
MRIAAVASLVLSLLTGLNDPIGHAYENPVSSGFADSFADPAVIRGLDGYWYAYGTSDPLREGEGTHHRLPIARSTDLVSWTYVGDAFGEDNLPPYAAPGSLLWAPDIRYLDGRYVMYFTVTNTTSSPHEWDYSIGAATAPTPTGPWTHLSAPVVAPRPSGDSYWNTIDPAQFTDVDGRKYLYFGGFFGGLWVTELSPDGLHTVGQPTQVAIDNKFEGSYVVRHDGYYYLLASSANCCAGPTTGYSVLAGRATSPRGPFTDREGLPLLASRAGGTPVLDQNGDRWIGTGHHAQVTDLAGQDWMAYHAIDRDDPFLDGPYGINERPMLLDRLDWIDGWPMVRAGAGPSEQSDEAPVTRGFVSLTDDLSGWRGDGWTVQDGYVRHSDGGGALTARRGVGGDIRAETDLRLEGPSAGLRVGRATVTVSADGLTITAGGARRTAALPGGEAASAGLATWHNLAVTVKGRTITAEVSSSRLGDPQATLRLHSPVPLSGGFALVSEGVADFDNVSVARLARPVTRPAPVPRPGRLIDADEFDGEESDGAGGDWQWVREDPDARVTGGVLRWPLQNADLVGTANTASVLLRDAPEGDYVVETKVTLDLGDDTVRNYQQAGLVAYASDDDFARLCQVAIWNTRQVEYGRELPFAGRLSYGGNIVGPPARTTWLRLAHHVDPANGEHEFRAASSRDGRTWTWGGVWTFPKDTVPRIGLVAHGGAQPAVDAEFDYLRVYRTR